MLSGLVLILGQTPAAAVARRVAFGIARDAQAPIAGLSIVDPEVIAPAEPVPMGGDAYKVHKDEVALEKARMQAADFERLFAEECGRSGVPCDATLVEGRTLRAVIDACASQDLVVAGRDLGNRSTQAQSVEPVLLSFLRDNPRPVIVCSEADVNDTGPTLVAYDASAPAMRSLQLFALLGLRKRAPVVVLTVSESQKDAAETSRSGAAYLQKHGYRASTQPVQGGDAIDAGLMGEAQRLGASLIVAGAYGRQGWREWLLGSTTRRLIEKSTTPLFVHH
jgi:nucleotide-binding universal stress UspA family protein